MANASNTLAKLREIGIVDDTLVTREVTWEAPNGETVNFEVKTKKELTWAENKILSLEYEKEQKGDEEADVLALRIHRTVLIDDEAVPIELAKRMKPSLKIAIINAISDVGEEAPKA